MFLSIEDRLSDSPLAERVWRCHSEHAGMMLSVAASHFEMVVTRHRGTTVLTLRFVDATANAGSGAIATGAGATVGITGSTLVRNTNFGMEQTDGSLLRSLQNNTVEDNVAGATSGGITNSTPI